MKNNHICIFIFLSLLLFLLLVPASAGGGHGHTCEGEEHEHDDHDDEHEDSKTSTRRLRIAAIFIIFIASALGVLLPVLGRWIPALRPEKDVFFVIKAFAAGVILATGFIHILPEAFERLGSECLNENPWQNFPFTGLIAMLAALGTLMVDSVATGYYKRRYASSKTSASGGGDQEKNESAMNAPQSVHVHSHGMDHPAPEKDTGLSANIRNRIIAQVLELGIVVHSVIIGITLGTSDELSTIRPLLGALTFHQFFEGMGLGSCIVQARFKATAVSVMAFFFSITTPVGIAVGIAISSGYNPGSNTALIVQGVLDAAAAGILIYTALVDLLAVDFMSDRMQKGGMLQVLSYVALLLGVTAMSILAKWA